MMVRFTFYYRACPVYLLCEYQSYHLMRECETGKGECRWFFSEKMI